MRLRGLSGEHQIGPGVDAAEARIGQLLVAVLRPGLRHLIPAVRRRVAGHEQREVAHLCAGPLDGLLCGVRAGPLVERGRDPPAGLHPCRRPHLGRDVRRELRLDGDGALGRVRVHRRTLARTRGGRQLGLGLRLRLRLRRHEHALNPLRERHAGRKAHLVGEEGVFDVRAVAIANPVVVLRDRVGVVALPDLPCAVAGQPHQRVLLREVVLYLVVIASIVGVPGHVARFDEPHRRRLPAERRDVGHHRIEGVPCLLRRDLAGLHERAHVAAVVDLVDPHLAGVDRGRQFGVVRDRLVQRVRRPDVQLTTRPPESAGEARVDVDLGRAAVAGEDEPDLDAGDHRVEAVGDADRHRVFVGRAVGLASLVEVGFPALAGAPVGLVTLPPCSVHPLRERVRVFRLALAVARAA